jgi:hypothetical protein
LIRSQPVAAGTAYRVAVRRFCCVRAGAGRCRPLQRRLVYGGPAHWRVRHPNGAWGAAQPCFWDCL